MSILERLVQEKLNTLCKIKVDSQEYYFGVHENKTKVTYYLYTKTSRSDMLRAAKGEEPLDPEIKSLEGIKLYATADYLAESITRMKKTGKITYFRGYLTIQKILNEISKATMYAFTDTEIIVNTEDVVQASLRKVFNAMNDEISFSYRAIDGMYSELTLITKDFNLQLKEVPFDVGLKNLPYIEMPSDVKKKLLVTSIKTVTYQTLCDTSDMSWFEEDGVRKKDYEAITNIEDFENKIITALARAVQVAAMRGEQVLLSIDTETTGLNIFELSDSNPIKDHCVAIPISWEDNKAYVIFTDMEFFDSIPNSYVMERLAPFITEPVYDDITKADRKELPRTITLRKVDKREESMHEMDAFDFDFSDNNSGNEEQGFDVDVSLDQVDVEEPKDLISNYTFSNTETVTFFRSVIDLIGHNSMYDGKVFYNEGCKIWFDEDTLQIAFNLNPGVGKGSKKLKALTRKIFGHETPELSDILGKGNEDKYRYLRDMLVAIIYGCADADYTRLLFKHLRPLMSDKMYKSYKALDMPMSNALYVSEYKGMPLQAEEVQVMAHESEENLNLLKEFLYSYVGKFIYVQECYDRLQDKLAAGLITEDEYKESLATSLQGMTDDKRYEFALKASDISYVIYGLLGYPIYDYTKGDANGNGKKPKTDKNVMKKLRAQKYADDEKPNTIWGKSWHMKNHLLCYGVTMEQYNDLIAKGKEKKAEELVLINCDEFNKCKYPLSIVLAKYAELNKEYTSYFKPIIEQNLEGRLFKPYSLARIETRRIANPGQTMKGKLKAMVRSYNDDYYLLDFDMSQVEYRIMASRAKQMDIVEKMKDPEKDYHIETSSLVNNKPADKITKKERKSTKCIGFGLPYGLTLPSLCENLFGDKSEEHLFQTAHLIAIWKKANRPIVEWLENQRDIATTEAVITEGLRDYIDAWEYDVVKDYKGKIISKTLKLDKDGHKIPKPVGMIKDGYGFYRIFDLSDKSERRIQSVRRQAGNYPIQCYAAELFRTILIRFRNACIKYGIEDKIVWHMLIHDELLCSVHKSVHPFLIYKIVKEACMITKSGHTNYFVGINIGKTWAETKDDAREAPVHFVERIVERYDAGEFKETWIDDPGAYIAPFRAQYVEDRIAEIIQEIQPNVLNEPLDINLILEKFTNYTVKGYILDYPENYKVDKKLYMDEKGKLDEATYSDAVWRSKFESWAIARYGEGKEYIAEDGSLKRFTKSTDVVIEEPKEVDYAELFEDDVNADTYWSFDEEGVSSNYSLVDYAEEEEEDAVKSYFEKVEINENVENAKSVADFLVEDKATLDHIYTTKKQIIIKVKNRRDINMLKGYLTSKTSSDGRSILFKTPTSSSRWLNTELNDDELKELDKYITNLNGGSKCN